MLVDTEQRKKILERLVRRRIPQDSCSGKL